MNLSKPVLAVILAAVFGFAGFIGERLLSIDHRLTIIETEFLIRFPSK